MDYDFKAAKISIYLRLFFILVMCALIFIGLGVCLINVGEMIWDPKNAVVPDTSLFAIVFYVSTTFFLIALNIYNFKYVRKMCAEYKQEKLVYKNMLNKGKETEYKFVIRKIGFDISSDLETKVYVYFETFANIKLKTMMELKYKGNFKKGWSDNIRFNSCNICVLNNAPESKLTELRKIENSFGQNTKQSIGEVLDGVIQMVITSSLLDYTTREGEQQKTFNNEQGFEFIVF